jgi:hypothetical protein
MTVERTVVLQRVILWLTGLRPVGLRLKGWRGKEATMKIEHAVAAGRAVGEVGFNALVVNALIVTLITGTLMIDALMLVTLGRLRSRTGSSIPIVFNLSIAQVLRLFSHWSHVSLI